MAQGSSAAPPGIAVGFPGESAQLLCGDPEAVCRGLEFAFTQAA